MTTIVTRETGPAAKGAPLTNTELDNNFINLNTNKIEVYGTPSDQYLIYWDATNTRWASRALTSSDVGLGSVENTALSTWAGTSNVVTLGTITTGTWHGNLIGLSYGGTNANLTAAAGAVAYSTSSALALSAAGSSGQVFKSNGTSAPSWVDQSTLAAGTATTSTHLASGAIAEIPYQTAAGTTTFLGGNTAATRKFLSEIGTGTAATAPTWHTLDSSDVGLGSVENTALSTWGGSSNIVTVGTITTGTWNATAIGLTKGGTGANITADAGAVVYSGASTLAVSAVGTSGQLFKSNGTSAPSWVDASTLTVSAASTATTATNLGSGGLGFVPYQSSSGATSFVVGNTTATKKFFSQSGTGSASAVPEWVTLTSTDVGLGSVENTALSTWAGSTNITTLGTIATGTWNATAISGSKQTVMVGDSGSGGTQGAVPAPITGDAVKFLRGDATWATINALPSQSGANGKYLKSDGSSASWDAIEISTADITGTLPVANGGTGAALTLSAGGVIYSAVSELAISAAGTSGQLFKSNGTSAPSWVDASTLTVSAASTATTATNLGSGGLGFVPYQSSSGATSFVVGNTTATKKFFSQSGTGSASAVPEWVTLTSTDVGLGSVENTALSTWAGSTNITTLGTIGTGVWNGTAVGILYGGTGATTKTAAFDALSPATTLGDVIYHDGTDNIRLAGNTTSTKKFFSQTGNGSISAAPSWITLTSTDVGLGSVENTALSTWAGSSNITTLGTVATGTWNATAIGLTKGGTGASITATAGAIVYSGASTLAVTAAGTSGQVLTSAGVGAPGWTTATNANTASAIVQRDSSGGFVAGLISPSAVTETSTAVSISGGTVAVNLNLGTIFDVSLNAAITTWTITNTQASGKISAFVVVFTADGTARSVTWPTGTKWPGGTGPTITSTSGKKDVFLLFTYDGGTSWNAFISGQNL